jgi:hypothetical protein
VNPDHGLRTPGARFVHPVDQMPFMIRLADIDFEAERLRLIFQCGGNVVERIRTINFGLARAQQIEVGAVQNIDQRLCRHVFSSGCVADNHRLDLARKQGKLGVSMGRRFGLSVGRT